MLREAVDILRTLWTGELITYDGEFYAVDAAQIYTRADGRIPVYVAASGPEAASLAAEIGDGLIASGGSEEAINTFQRNVESGPASPNRSSTSTTTSRVRSRGCATGGPIQGSPGELSAELPLPRHLEQAATGVHEEDLRGAAVTGTDVGPYGDRIAPLREAGFTHVFLH
jgi:coenzyme F420-dependent glucose-6-phosphate dehydrogenase